MGPALDALKLATDHAPLLLLQVGCYFMGIVGVVCKAHIARYSELLSLGLATGLMGSITTYSSWNQDMAALFVAGMWAKAIFGIIVGGTSVSFFVSGQEAFLKGFLDGSC